MNEVHHNSYQFKLKPTWFGYVLMFRDAVPDCAPGEWRFSSWRKATWKEIDLYERTRP